MRFNRTVIAAAILAASCGGSRPVAPTPTPTGPAAPGGGLQFQAARYNLDIIALSCPPDSAGEPAIFAVSLAVTLQPDTSGWTAVPVNSNATLSVRFLPAADNRSAPAQLLSGSAGGFADDEGATGSLSPNGTRLVIDGSVPLSGVLINGTAIGKFDGPLAFTQTGISTTCAGVNWLLTQLSVPAPAI